MGATTFFEEVKGTDSKQTYEALVANAIIDWGRDSYNGTISTTSGCVEIRLPKDYDGDAYDYAHELLQSDGKFGIEKYGKAGFLIIDEEDTTINVPYATSQTRIGFKGTRKWQTLYKVMGYEGTEIVEVGSYSKQVEAEKKAKERTVKLNDISWVEVTKELVNTSQTIVRFHPKTKKQKVKNGLKKWLVFGWAAE